jgi:hypothetical protein
MVDQDLGGFLDAQGNVGAFDDELQGVLQGRVLLDVHLGPAHDAHFEDAPPQQGAASDPHDARVLTCLELAENHGNP